MFTSYHSALVSLQSFDSDQLSMSLATVLLLATFVVAILAFKFWSRSAKNSTALPPATATSVMHAMVASKASHLSPDIISRIKSFVFFIGYGRSGHSIIGSLMDAHPHMIVAHNTVPLFSRFSKLNQVSNSAWKSTLFDMLYENSVGDAFDIRKNPEKGYTLEVEGLWQGRFDKYVEVIGERSGGKTTKEYLKDKAIFIQNYRQLKEMLSMPMRVIFAVRNPFDTISTKLNYKITSISQYRKLKHAIQSKSCDVQKLSVSDQDMMEVVTWLFEMVDAVKEMIELFGSENVLEVHNCELVDKPRKTLSRIFQFLEVDASEQVLEVCAAKVFKSVSTSRNTVEWSAEMRMVVEQEMRNHRIFDRYSFTSN